MGGGGSLWRGSGTGDQIYPWPYYYYARFVEAHGTDGMTDGMHCHTMPVHGAVGTCGGVPSKGIPDCEQPVSGKAPMPQLSRAWIQSLIRQWNSQEAFALRLTIPRHRTLLCE